MGRLQATLDLHNHVVLQTLYMLHLRSAQTEEAQDRQTAQSSREEQEDELYFLLALLNSHLLQEYLYILYTAYKLVQPQIEQHVLRQIPIPTSVSVHEKAQISQRARQLMLTCDKNATVVELKEHYTVLYEEQEQAIRMLYRNALAGQMCVG